jgi:Cyclin, N-terminal domain
MGARVVQGNYLLRDPTEDGDDHSYDRRGRKRQGSVTSMDTMDETTTDNKTMRIPPSLTLSKIRSLKRQALQAAVQANLNIGSLALSCVYFERLCLDCRVDKTNRRVTFAACILLAAKLNEPHVGLVMQDDRKAVEDNEDNGFGGRIQSRMVKPNKRSGKMFASLLYFFTEGWHLSLKHLFAAEWGVFAALGFSLHSSPTHVAFHFLRLMKTLEWKPMEYLGPEMYAQWQKALKDEEELRMKRKRRKEGQRKQKEERILSLHKELESELIRRQEERMIQNDTVESPSTKTSKAGKTHDQPRQSLLNRLRLRKSMSHEGLHDMAKDDTLLLVRSPYESVRSRRGSNSVPRFVSSESMPIFSSQDDDNTIAIDIPEIPDAGGGGNWPILFDLGGQQVHTLLKARLAMAAGKIYSDTVDRTDMIYPAKVDAA